MDKCGKLFTISEEEPPTAEDEDNYGDFSFVDPRHSTLGARLLTAAEDGILYPCDLMG